LFPWREKKIFRRRTQFRGREFLGVRHQTCLALSETPKTSETGQGELGEKRLKKNKKENRKKHGEEVQKKSPGTTRKKKQ